MPTLALDVDGVLIDPVRSGRGHWTEELERRHGIPVERLREAFFVPTWGDVIRGRRPLEPALAEALERIGATLSVEEVIAFWLETDLVLDDAVVDLARRAAGAGVRVALATNQEHRRAAHLSERLGGLFPVAAVIYSADLGVQKHEAAFFARATERLGVVDRPADVVFVDDVPLNLDRAREAGWRAVLATPDRRWIPDVERLLGLDR